jgi:trk system potassium uptake protein TrkH
VQALRYAVRSSPVLKYFGQLCVILALLTVLPFIVSIASGDYSAGLRYLIVTIVVFALGVFLRRLPTPKTLQTNEAMIITAITLLFAALIMIWPLMSGGLNYLDALFESVSGVTTTGLTVTASVANKPISFLFSRAWMQWYGGLGFAVFSLAMVVQPVFAAKRIGIVEDFREDVLPGAGIYARRILVVYMVLTGLGIVLLGLVGSGWLNAVLYSLAAVSTGGFSPSNSSIGNFTVPIQIVVILISVTGAIPLILYYRTFRKGWRTFVDDLQLRSLILTGLIVALILAFFLYFQSGFSWKEAWLNGALNAFSAQTTTGFSSTNIYQISNGAKLLLIFSMLLGGSSGSSAGGIKIIRLIVLIRLVYLMVARTSMPRQAVAEVSVGGRKLELDEVQNTVAIILAFLVLIAFSWLPFVIMGYNPLNSLFEVTSAATTTGLSAGITSPGLHPVLKGVLCVDMLVGRLEIFAWLVLVYPGSWIGRRLEE